MDKNKLKVLQTIKYTIAPHCGICIHADLSSDGWGYCNFYSYNHIKHSEGTSRLSITRAGRCTEGFERSEDITSFGSFDQFMKE